MSVDAHYLGKITYAEALAAQERAWLQALAGGRGTLLGFEAQPVITLGIRGTAQADLRESENAIKEKGFEIVKVDRGGQATIHHPGQLVIFPVVDVTVLGAKRWARALAEITRRTLAAWDVDTRWDECKPGLYTAKGKIVSMGLRVRQGVSTHGIAINVSNDLEDFRLIRACGDAEGTFDRFPRPVALSEVFAGFHKRFAVDLVCDSYEKNS